MQSFAYHEPITVQQNIVKEPLFPYFFAASSYGNATGVYFANLMIRNQAKKRING